MDAQVINGRALCPDCRAVMRSSEAVYFCDACGSEWEAEGATQTIDGECIEKRKELS